VIIIVRGRIALDQQLASLRRQGAIMVEARGPADQIRAMLGTIPGIDRVVIVRRDSEYACLEIQTRDGQDLRETISHRLVTNGWPLRQLDLRRSTLEERFTQVVTQDTLADAQPEAV
jgi:ABC-2 type transport system ATP-binding protein